MTSPKDDSESTWLRSRIRVKYVVSVVFKSENNIRSWIFSFSNNNKNINNDYAENVDALLKHWYIQTYITYKHSQGRTRS